MNMHSLLILWPALLLAVPALAQVPGATRQVDQSDQRRRAEESARTVAAGEAAPELYSGEAADLGPQTVLGVARPRHHFAASADVQYYYTDNFFLNESPFRQETTVLLSTVDVALAPTPYPLGGGRFAPRIGVRHQWYNFGLETDRPFDFYDFRAQSVYGEGRFRFADHWIAEAGVEALRLVNHNTGDEFYKEIAPRWGIAWRYPLCRAATFEAGYRGIYRITEEPFTPDNYQDRLDTIGHAALSITLGERFVAQPFYRFQHTHYSERFFGDNRDGQLHTFGLGLFCFLSDSCSLRGFFGYDLAEFRSPFLPDYRNLTAGGGVNLTLRF
jgi:hypothetical protein